MTIDGYLKRLVVGLAVLFLISAFFWAGRSDGGASSQPARPQTNQKQPASSAPLADLEISAIEVFPAQPQAGQQFAVNVYVTNSGQAQSGEYDLAISIKDVGRGATYPVGTFRNAGLQPGENVVAYTSSDRLVNDPGSFQVHVEIKPFLYEDGDLQNNTNIWAFTVQ